MIKIPLDDRDESGLSFGGVDKGGRSLLGSHVGELLESWKLNGDDTLFLYIRCHGRVDNDGIWHGVDPQGVSFSIAELLTLVRDHVSTLVLLVDGCHSNQAVTNIEENELLDGKVGGYLVLSSSKGRINDGTEKYSEDVLAYRHVFFRKEPAALGRVKISGSLLPSLLHHLSGPANDLFAVADRVIEDLGKREAKQSKGGSLPLLHSLFPKWRSVGEEPKAPTEEKVRRSKQDPRTGTGSSPKPVQAAGKHRHLHKQGGATTVSAQPESGGRATTTTSGRHSQVPQGSGTGGSSSSRPQTSVRSQKTKSSSSSAHPRATTTTSGGRSTLQTPRRATPESSQRQTGSSKGKQGGNIVESLFEEATTPDGLSMTGLWDMLYPNQRRMHKIKPCRKDRRRKGKKLVGPPSSTRNWPAHKRRHGLSRLHRHHSSQKM